MIPTCRVDGIGTYYVSHTGLFWYGLLSHRTVDSTAVRNVILCAVLYHDSRQYRRSRYTDTSTNNFEELPVELPVVWTTDTSSSRSHLIQNRHFLHFEIRPMKYDHTGLFIMSSTSITYHTLQYRYVILAGLSIYVQMLNIPSYFHRIAKFWTCGNSDPSLDIRVSVSRRIHAALAQ